MQRAAGALARLPQSRGQGVMIDGRRGGALVADASAMPMRAIVIALVAFLSVAALTGLAWDRDGSTVERAARSAGEEHDVPPRLLLAMAYAESRLSLVGPEGERRGWLRIVPWRPSRSAAYAATLMGGAASDYESDPVQGMRAAAALVVAAQRRLGRAPDPDPAAWRHALERFNGGYSLLANRLYADQVIALAARGFAATTDDGALVSVAGIGGRAVPVAVGERPVGLVGAQFAAWVPASARASRPLMEPRAVRFIVIHTMENTFSTILDFFASPATGVAAHYLIRSSDGLTVQMVDERQVAFHDACFNEESIGIEHEGYVAAGPAWYGDAMLEASANLVRDIARRHRIPLDREHILGHGEAPDCSDHTDPGPHWDWDRFMQLVRR
jgi:N-acetylmuramoyl-L-alanine amidase